MQYPRRVSKRADTAGAGLCDYAARTTSGVSLGCGLHPLARGRSGPESLIELDARLCQRSEPSLKAGVSFQWTAQHPLQADLA